jgi:hypothetical protein
LAARWTHLLDLLQTTDLAQLSLKVRPLTCTQTHPRSVSLAGLILGPRRALDHILFERDPGQKWWLLSFDRQFRLCCELRLRIRCGKTTRRERNKCTWRGSRSCARCSDRTFRFFLIASPRAPVQVWPHPLARFRGCSLADCGRLWDLGSHPRTGLTRTGLTKAVLQAGQRHSAPEAKW